MTKVNQIASLALLLIVSLSTVGLLVIGYMALNSIKDAAEKVTRIAEIVATPDLPDVELDPESLLPGDLPDLSVMNNPTTSVIQSTKPVPVAESENPNEFPGICGRTPAVQRTLIEQLGIQSCRSITADELYRVEGLGVETEYMKRGDLADLPNLRYLVIEIPRHGLEKRPLPAGLFTDLSALELLQIDIEAPEPAPRVTVRIDKGLFEGLSNLKRMSVEGVDQVSSDAFDNTPALESIELRGENDNGKPRFDRGLIRNLPQLTELRTSNFNMPKTLLVANPRAACLLDGRIDSIESLSVDEADVEVLERDDESCRVIIGGDRVVDVDVTPDNR